MDYLRQLSNDEKRSRCATVATVEGKDLEGPLASPDLGVSTIQDNLQSQVFMR